jgi:branched-chain amino acid aminotransferase
MPTRININGVITPPEDAKISVLDHGLLFGDSIYETLRTYGGKPFLFSRHFTRLDHSAKGIDLELPWEKLKILEEIRRTLLTGESRVRLIITRGIGEISAGTETCTGPAVIIIVVPLIAPPESIYTQGVDVVISSVRRSQRFADIKTGSLIHQVLARREANSKGAYEAILLTPDGRISDGITSNIYLVRDGKLLTPGLDAGIVAGITRSVILDLAERIGLQVVEGVLDPAEIEKADEMFLTSTTREVVPVVRVGGKPVGTGKAGRITHMLLNAYRAAVIDYLLAED